MNKFLAALLASACFLLGCPITGQAAPIRPDTWTAVDGLGRQLPSSEDVEKKTDKERYVAMFYWLWHGIVSNVPPRNITAILEEHPEAVNDYDHPAWGTATGGFFWDEPLFGYYSMLDAYVLRKHAELLADAGVDVLIFDCSNVTFTFPAAYENLLQVFEEARAEGVNTPKIAFLLNFSELWEEDTNTIVQLRDLYNKLYRDGRYQDHWFYWEGKPLILADKTTLNRSLALHQEIYDFFTFRNNRPSYRMEDTPIEEESWGWCSIYPQTRFGVRDDGSVEEMCVSVAQNHDGNGTTAMNNPNGSVKGRSYTDGSFSYSYSYEGKNVKITAETDQSYLYGLNFQQQWDYAIAADPDIVFVTGWNEWRADRQKSWGPVENAFVDQFSPEYSRDIEPSAGVLADHYYYQLVSNIRRYKGVSHWETPEANVVIDITQGSEQWAGVLPEYSHYTGSTRRRDADGYQTTHYENDTMRNDICSAKVAYDDASVYFYVQTLRPLSDSSDPAWMRLFLDTDSTGSQPHWEGFEYVLNRTSPNASEATLERSTGGWNWESVGKVRYTVQDTVLQIAIPREYLNFGTGGEIPSFGFKWADNMQEDGNILDFYQNGDVAPGGRFRFLFGKPAAIEAGKPSSKFPWGWVAAGGAGLLGAGGIGIWLSGHRKRPKATGRHLDKSNLL